MPLPVSLRRFKGIGLSDAVLGLFVILVLGLLIVPLPAWLLDLALSANLAVAVTIVLVTLYVSRALDIAVFPSLLLLTTLLRLGLNVASTRLILLDGYAGEVIGSFGRFVVRGNYAVGGIVFFVLCVIQYLVIAKGSERVAEVGARFALDSMPGKQMTLDAEVRAGTLDQRTAKERRRALERESQFYGAMDGAMKFVKGDVIAGFVITVVNLVGGFAIGTLDRGLRPLEALQRYGLLAVGDGLVAQIPSIVLAVGAGILVTRVGSEVEEQSLARDLSMQLLGLPKALLVAGCFIGLLGFVPGLPTVPFLVIAVLLVSVALLRERYRELPHERTTPSAASLASRAMVPQLVPLRIVVGSGFVKRPPATPELLTAKDVPLLFELLNALRHRVFERTGVRLPHCRFECDGYGEPHALRLELKERPVLRWSESEDTAEARAALASRLESVLVRHASSFLSLSETQRLLDSLEELDPQAVRQVIPKVVSLSLLNEILVRLVDESVCIRDLSGILLALSRVAGAEKSPARLTELLRSELKDALSYSVVQEGNLIRSVVLDPSLEDVIRSAITTTGTEQHLALSGDALRDLTRAISRALDEARQKVQSNLVLLAAPDIRRHTRKLIEVVLPETPVLTYSELLPELVVETVAVASLFGLDSDDE